MLFYIAIFASLLTLDTQDRKVVQYNSPRTMERIDRGDPLTINDIIKLTQSGISDEIILSFLTTKYRLTPSQIRRLTNEGVSQRVIQKMS